MKLIAFRNALAIFIAVFSFIGILRETGYINLSLYQSEEHHSADITWIDNGHGPKSELPLLIVMGRDTLLDESRGTNRLTINIESFETGPLWTPLYKSADFSAKASPLYQQDPKYAALALGEFNIKGIITIKGFCSRRQALALIKQTVVNNFTTETRKHLNFRQLALKR